MWGRCLRLKRKLVGIADFVEFGNRVGQPLGISTLDKLGPSFEQHKAPGSIELRGISEPGRPSVEQRMGNSLRQSPILVLGHRERQMADSTSDQLGRKILLQRNEKSLVLKREDIAGSDAQARRDEDM